MVRRQDATENLLSLGATKVIVTDGKITAQELKSQLMLLTQNKGISYAADCVGGDVAEGMYQALGLYGHQVNEALT